MNAATSDIFTYLEGLMEVFGLAYSILCVFDFDKPPGDQTNHTENSLKILAELKESRLYQSVFKLIFEDLISLISKIEKLLLELLKRLYQSNNFEYIEKTYNFFSNYSKSC